MEMEMEGDNDDGAGGYSPPALPIAPTPPPTPAPSEPASNMETEEPPLATEAEDGGMSAADAPTVDAAEAEDAADPSSAAEEVCVASATTSTTTTAATVVGDNSPAPALPPINTDLTTSTTNATTAATGLFAGLTLTPGASQTPITSSAPASSSTETTIGSTGGTTKDPTPRGRSEKVEGDPPSRASTPVHSNTSPPVTPSGEDVSAAVAAAKEVVRPIPRSAITASSSPSAAAAAAHVPLFPTTPTGATGARIHLSTVPSARVPHPDTALRLLRKFYTKTSPSIPIHAGGTQPSSWFGWVFGSSAETAGNSDGNLECFREFSEVLEVDQEGEDDDGTVGDASFGAGGGGGDEDAIVESILGHRGDSPSKARNSIASFVQLLATWCRSSMEAAALLAEMEASGEKASNLGVGGVMGAVTPELIAVGIDIASALVAHGCLDDLYLRLGDASDSEESSEGDEMVGAESEEEVGAPSLVKKAVNMLLESVCVADLSEERMELSALKFLLTTGCRMATVASAASDEGGDALVDGEPSTSPAAPFTEPMLRGTHLLQTIRVCSSIYLHTASESNRTTAKAALQQLVITVFVRLERTIERKKLEDRMAGSGGVVASTVASSNVAPGPTFASQDHRDAYLVLRSLCKLSMQTAARSAAPQAIVLTSAAGPEGAAPSSAGAASPTVALPEVAPAVVTVPQPPIDDAYDPALESRILALKLLLHILRHSSAPIILEAGPQFHYAVRQYLCTSLLKNTTSLDTTMVELSLRLFVPLIRNFRSLLKTEIEAFVTNVFFVILDSKNSTVQHKLLVVTLFEEICSDATTLAEIFLNYDCDLSAVDLFSRIVNALGKVARVGLSDGTGSEGYDAPSSLQFVAGAGAIRAEMTRLDHRELRLAAMKAMRQVLASLHSSIVIPVNHGGEGKYYLGDISHDEASLQLNNALNVNGDYNEKTIAEAVEQSMDPSSDAADATAKKTLVEMYDSKKKRREEESQAALKFNQKPTAGLKFAGECGHVDASDPTDVARYLLQNKDAFDKAQIGEYLGREKEWQDGFALKVLRAYGDALDFKAMPFDDAIRYYLSGFRLPGEAQKIDRIMEVFAARYTDQNPGIFPTADSAFILAFSIIMLNTDLHNPAIKEDRKMTIASFIRMNSGVCDGGDFPDEMLTEIFGRIKNDPISLKEDDDARESAGVGNGKGAATPATLSTAGLSEFFFGSHYVDQDKTREVNYQKEGDQIVRDTESMLRRRRKATKSGSGSKKTLRDSLKKNASMKFVGTADSGLRDEYVTPMFDVAWGPAMAVFSTAIESANGTDGILASIATEEEMDHAVDNAALAIEVSLNGFQLAICIAGLCGNHTARDAYVRALYNFTLLGSSHLLADRHIQCVQSLLRLGRDDSELLGVTWEHIFRALTEIYRLHQVWEGMARNERKEIKARERAARRVEKEALASASQLDDSGRSVDTPEFDDDVSDTSSEMSDWNDVHYLEDEMDKRMIDEANAMFIHDTVPLDLVDSIFQRSTALSRRSLKDFVYQLCRVSRMEISGYGGHVGSDANDIDLTNDHYMKHHTLVSSNNQHGALFGGAGIGSTQPAIYSLEKLVEVTHFNMESRPRLIFADIWGTISMHLTSTALHEEAAVAMYAVDSLRQLSLQFLNREELGVFEFQRRFLKSLETIMGRSTHVSVKELLLSSVEQLISIYGFGDGSGNSNGHQGTLRSGWRSILIVIGTAGLDKNDSIALQGFKLLTGQIEQCLSVANEAGEDGDVRVKQPDSLLSEYFVDLVNTLLLYISGPRQDLSTKSIDSLVQMSDVLAEGKVKLSSTRRKSPTSPVALPRSGVETSDVSNDALELWWPMLLGLSQTMGDRRPEVRVKGLGTLMSIINKHFFPSTSCNEKVCANGDSGESNSSPQHGDLQTLQLIFRGILVPALEFEEMDGNSTSGFAPELLPSKFVHFITVPPIPEADESGANDGGKGEQDWIDTTFEYLMDGCISICLRSLVAFNSDSLVEEVLAMLNSCLLSDSGHLAVKGLRRLQQFVSQDLEMKDISDDTWATVSHMLFRVLSIRGLPPLSLPEKEGATEEQKKYLEQEYDETMNEFIREQRFFSNRRYIGCNAAMVIGSLLTNKLIEETMGVHWYIFLTSGLGKGIKDWERAAEILDSKTARPDTTPSPPHYLENVLYARRWMTKFLLSLLTQRDLSTLESAPCQRVLKEETESLLRAFLAKGSADEHCSAIEMRNISGMVIDILECFNSLGDDKLSTMKWLSPLLSACIQTNNGTIRTSVQILLTRMLKGANQTSSMANGNTPSEDTL
mmetsp:Transcript_3373/g.6295  ORF Transcript_3373/g.6295 Transcript_3373/m.6295 type:complete len:2294 (-) Transcript_3373:61-6942(-)